jgi:hypothetical protein
MRSKGHRSTYSLLILFVGIFAFWWGIAVLARNDKSTPAVSYVASASPVSTADTYVPQTVSGPVAIEATIVSGTHTYKGSIPLTSMCDALSTGISVSGSNPEHVSIVLTLKRPSTCAEETTGAMSQPFAVSLAVPSNTEAVFDGLTINGAIVATTLKITTQ